MQAGLVQHPHHLAKQHVDAAGSLFHDGVEPEHAGQAEQHRLGHEGAHENHQRGHQKVDHLDTPR